ncbi:ribosomal RNA small subunit methyltransferase E [bacterium BMS3Abin04]|nr:ribosomal RNA small subunit methyltransferase E [bacterium BMS3Abin04]
MNIILLNKNDIIKPNIYKLTGKIADHIINILRANVDDYLEVGIINGPIGKAQIIILKKEEVVLRLMEMHAPPGKFSIDLICALPRPQTLKKILSVSATMGINSIHFIMSNRVEKSFFNSTLLKDENYLQYILDGLSQGKRTKVPKIYFYKRFKKFFEEDFSFGAVSRTNITLKLVAEGSSKNCLTDVFPKTVNNIILAIGPEGGWISFEIKFMEKHGFIPFKISNSVLRVESAVTAALAQIELVNISKKKI